MIIYIRIKLAKYDVSYIIMGNHDTRRLAFVSINSSDIYIPFRFFILRPFKRKNLFFKVKKYYFRLKPYGF